MATYAIGDVQGCHATLQALLERVRFDAGTDRVWAVGDLVNRGPRSLDVLRWAVRHPRLTAVLGNHDLHLLAAAAGARQLKGRDTLAPVLEADDAPALLDWVRRLPLLHVEGEHVLVHAGLPPGWSVELARTEAAAVEERLRADDWQEFLRELYAKPGPSGWSAELAGAARLRFTVKALTRMRGCRGDGSLDMSFNGPLSKLPSGLLPWFRHPARCLGGSTVVCGHWAALGLHLEPGVVALDSGCVWGRSLTAFRLDDRFLFQEPARD